jgi:hypothetical protein
MAMLRLDPRECGGGRRETSAEPWASETEVIRGREISEVGDRFRSRWARIERLKFHVNARALCEKKVGVGLSVSKRKGWRWFTITWFSCGYGLKKQKLVGF